MITVQKLLGYLSRPYKRDATPVEAFRFSVAPTGGIWSVGGGRIRIERVGDPIPLVDAALGDSTIGELVAVLSGLPNVTAQLSDATIAPVSTITLLEGSGSATSIAPAQILAATSPIWHYYSTLAQYLQDAKQGIADMLRELFLHQSAGEWLDVWLQNTLGGMRFDEETDVQLRTRIINETTRIRSNNRALELAALQTTGVAVQILDIPWSLQGNALHTFGGPGWRDTQVTNSVNARLFPSFGVDTAVIAQFGLSTLPDGRPEYAPGVPLQAAFAVIFPSSATCEQRAAVLRAIEPHRAAGTASITFRETGGGTLLVTNTPGHITNDPGFVTGPNAGEFIPFTC